MRKADKRKILLEGMTPKSKIRWAAQGRTTYVTSEAGIEDLTKPTGFKVERYGFYFKHSETNEARFLTEEELEQLGRRDTAPTSQSDRLSAMAYCLFKCVTDSDGKSYTGKHSNQSWFIRYCVEMGFDVEEALVVLADGQKWFEVQTMCRLLASSAGIDDLPSLELSANVPDSHKMEEVKTVSFAQLMINRMAKHKETRFKDIDADSSDDSDPTFSEYLASQRGHRW